MISINGNVTPIPVVLLLSYLDDYHLPVVMISSSPPPRQLIGFTQPQDKALRDSVSCGQGLRFHVSYLSCFVAHR